MFPNASDDRGTQMIMIFMIQLISISFYQAHGDNHDDLPSFIWSSIGTVYTADRIPFIIIWVPL